MMNNGKLVRRIVRVGKNGKVAELLGFVLRQK